MKKSLQTILALSFVASVAMASTPTAVTKAAKTYFETAKEKADNGWEYTKETFAAGVDYAKGHASTLCDIAKANPGKTAAAVAGTVAVVGGAVYTYKHYQALRTAINKINGLQGVMDHMGLAGVRAHITEALKYLGWTKEDHKEFCGYVNAISDACSVKDAFAFEAARKKAITAIQDKLNSKFVTRYAGLYVDAVNYVAANKAKVAGITAAGLLLAGLGYTYALPYVQETEMYKKAAAKASEALVWVKNKMPEMPAMFKKTEVKPAANTQGQPAANTQGQPEVKTQGQPEVKTQGQPEVKTPGKPAVNTQGQPTEKTPGKPAVKTPAAPRKTASGVPGSSNKQIEFEGKNSVPQKPKTPDEGTFVPENEIPKPVDWAKFARSMRNLLFPW